MSTLFNPQTQYVEDVSSINKQVESNAAEDGAYYAGLIKADAEYNIAQAKGVVTAFSDLLGKTAQFAKEQNVRNQEKAESDYYEKGVDWENNKYSLVWNDQKFIDGEAYNNAVQAKQTTVGAENLTPEGNGVLAGVMLLGDVEGENQKTLLRSRRDRYSEFFQVARGEQGVKIARGNGTTFTLDSAKNYEERRIAERAIRGIWLRESIKDGSTATQRRRILHKEMRRVEQAAALEWDKSVKDSIKVAKNKKLELDLSEIVNGDLPGENDVDANGEYIPNAFVESIERDRTWYDPISEGGTGDLGVSRQAKFDILMKMAEAGTLDIATINKLGNSWFTGKDGGRHQIKSIWGTQYRALLAKAVDHRRMQNDVDKEEKQGEIDAWSMEKQKEISEQEGPVEDSQIEALREEFQSNPRWRGFKEPEIISNYYTKQEENNDQIKQKVLATAAKLEPVDLSALVGWTGDPEGKLKLIETVKAANLAALNSTEIASRDKYITTAASIKLGEQDALPGKNSLEYINAVAGATKEYNRVYAQTMATTGGDKAASNTKALDAVEAGIKAGIWEQRERKEISEDTTNAVSDR